MNMKIKIELISMYIYIQFIYLAVQQNQVGLLSLCLKYFDKNGICLKNGINYEDEKGDNCLTYLLKEYYCNENWLNLLFKISKKCKINFEQKYIDKAIEYINKNVKVHRFQNGKFKSIIQSETQ